MANIAQDFLLTAIIGGDLTINNGDFVVGPSDTQNIADIINDSPGDWKEYPNLGVGLLQYQNADQNTAIIAGNIIQQLNNDGFITNIPIITFDNSTDTLNIQPRAVRSQN